MKRFLFCLFAFHGLLIGCAQKAVGEKPIKISPVSNEESHLIQLRLESKAIHPYEQLDWGTGSSQKADPDATHFGKLHSFFFDSIHSKNNMTSENPTQELVTLLQWVHQTSIDYFKNNPGDQASYSRVQSGIPDSTCFDDGKESYCGPGLLSGVVFLVDPNSWKILHEWLTAIDKAMPLADVNSAAFENLVRNFDYGIFSQLELALKSILNEPVCTEAQKQLEAMGETPRHWEMNLCDLVFAHKAKRNFRSGRI